MSFSEEDKEFGRLYDLDAASEKELRKMIIPGEEAIKKILPEVQIKKSAIYRLYTGKDFRRDDLTKRNDMKPDEVFAAFAGEKFIGIYHVIDREEIFAKPEFVMQPIKKGDKV